MILGAHVSSSGGIHLAPARGAEIGANAIQVFTKSPNQWRDTAVPPNAREALAKSMSDHDIRGLFAHDSYLINMASPDPSLNAKSITAFEHELHRCETLGIPYLVSHPGNYIDDRLLGLKRNAQGYNQALRKVPGTVKILIEATAGTATSLGSTFEELSILRSMIAPEFSHRIAWCLDTCHLFSAGYDLRNRYDEVWEQFDRMLGFEHLYCLHLNDSRTPFGSRRDRHELIGKGSLGPEPFKRIMRDPRLDHVARILETPKGDDGVTNDRRAIAKLRSWSDTPTPC
jgi:deoxyribonuclease-4